MPFDWAGQASAIVAMGALTYGAIEAGAQGFTAPGVVTALVVAALALTAFPATQARGAHPMMPLGLFRSRNVSVAVAVGFAFMAGYYGLPFVMSLYLQQLRGLSPLATGVAFLPMMVIGAAFTPLSARIGERLGGAHHRRPDPDDRGPGHHRTVPSVTAPWACSRSSPQGGWAPSGSSQ